MRKFEKFENLIRINIQLSVFENNFTIPFKAPQQTYQKFSKFSGERKARQNETRNDFKEHYFRMNWHLTLKMVQLKRPPLKNNRTLFKGDCCYTPMTGLAFGTETDQVDRVHIVE